MQIILVKQVNIPVYSIEVRTLSLMHIVNPLHARVHWPFQGDASLVDPFVICFTLVFVMPSCLFLVALWSPAGWELAS